MAKAEEKVKALTMRRSGCSIKEIARKLSVSRGTASLWVRGIELTSAQQKVLHDRMVKAGIAGRILGAQMNKRAKEERIRKAKKAAESSIVSVSKDQLFYLGLGLYWGEGSKSASTALAISNSDPAVIQIAMQWFEKCFGVSRPDFQPRIFINATHRGRERKLLAYWAKLLQLPESQFAKTIFIQRTNQKVYENHEAYYGILALRIRKGTDLRYRILALIARLGALDAMPR